MRILISIALFLAVLVAPHFAGQSLYDAYFRFWNVKSSGTVGDAGALASVNDKSDAVWSFAFRVDTGHTISEIVYSKFNISSPIDSNNTFQGIPFTTANQTRSRLKLQDLSINFRNLIFEDEYISMRWDYGMKFLDFQNTQFDTIGNRLISDAEGYLPYVGIEGEWFIRNFLSLRGHVRYSDFNLAGEDMRWKDFELGLVYTPYDVVNFEVGWKNYSLDVEDVGPAGTRTQFSQNMKGLYSQLNWLF